MAGTSALVSGASFAGLTTAYWLNRLGYHVTLVEVGSSLKRGGTPVDITGKTIDILARMKILNEVREHALPSRSFEFKGADDRVQAQIPAEPAGDDEKFRYEIPRDDLLRILFSTIEDEVEVIFSDTITSLSDTPKGVNVAFRYGVAREFSLVFGCDGNHSLVRRLRFGDESQFSHFLGHYFAISIVDHLIIAANKTEIFNVPGKAIMLNSYEDKTDIIFHFRSTTEIPYDYRNQAQQREILAGQFKDEGWRAPSLMKELQDTNNFYFDKLCQIKMPRWSDGRVALVGDAAYCASPAAGMGGSLAIIGAMALADALAAHGSDVLAAFDEYERNLRPFIDKIQEQAIFSGLPLFFPETKEQIAARNQAFSN